MGEREAARLPSWLRRGWGWSDMGHILPPLPGLHT
jgi:hypothetical protein